MVRFTYDKGAYPVVKGHKEDAGVDLRTPIVTFIKAGGSAVIDTGVHCDIPCGYYGKLESKSGLNIKHDIVCLGGVIDSGYEGSVRVKLYNFGERDYTFSAGDKVVQMIVHRHYADDLDIAVTDNGARGNDGFGSTGA